MQIQQQTAIKLQAHMMKNCPQMMPTIEQQKSIQLQMLAHMKRQLADKPDFVDKFT